MKASSIFIIIIFIIIIILIIYYYYYYYYLLLSLFLLVLPNICIYICVHFMCFCIMWYDTWLLCVCDCDCVEMDAVEPAAWWAFIRTRCALVPVIYIFIYLYIDIWLWDLRSCGSGWDIPCSHGPVYWYLDD